jgi:hypothetical protein
MPDCFSLWIKPLCQTLSNALLISQKTTRIKHPLCKLFNLSLRVASYPSQWKRANITPVFKSYCDSSVTSTVHGHKYSSPSIFYYIFHIKTTCFRKNILKLSLGRFLWNFMTRRIQILQHFSAPSIIASIPCVTKTTSYMSVAVPHFTYMTDWWFSSSI